MLHRLRRSRFGALLMLLLAPGLGGAGLQAAHPCPVEMPWAAGADVSDHAHHGHDAAPSEEGGVPGQCHCVGACQSAVTAPAPQASTLGYIPAAVRDAIVIGAPRWVAATRPLDRLPPPTAPPHVRLSA